MAIDQASMVTEQRRMEAEAGPPLDKGRMEKRLARGLEDISYLFLSRPSDGAAAKDAAAGVPAEGIHPRPEQSPSLLITSPSQSLNRDQLIALLSKNAAALEEGMRAIDMDVPCESCRAIDLLAVDGADQLSIVDIENIANDGMLLRALFQFDWLLRNMAFMRRVYRIHAFNFSSPPRIFLVAPNFLPTVICAAHRITGPRINCMRYHLAAMPQGTGIFFEGI